MFGQYSSAGNRKWREAAQAINDGKAHSPSSRIRRTFNDPSNIAHLWAHQAQDSAKYRDNFYFSGRSIFSYGSHFLAGFIMPDGAHSRDVALINADRYSVTTGRHMGVVRSATRHMDSFELPSLTDLRDVLGTLADVSLTNINERLAGSRAFRKLALADITDMEYPAKSRALAASNARNTVARWIAGNVAEFSRDDAGARFIAELAGFTAAEFNRMIAKAVKAAEARKEKQAEAERERERREAKAIAAMSDSAFRATWPADGNDSRADSYDAKRSKEFAKKLFRLARSAKAAGWTRVAAKVKARERDYRAHSAGRESRIIAAYRAERVAEIRRFRSTGELPANLYLYQRTFPAIHRALERSQARQFAERHAAAFAAWQSGQGERPYAGNYEKGSAEESAILESIRCDRAFFLEAYAKWKASEGERPAKLATGSIPRYGEPDTQAINDATRDIDSDIAREKREAAEAEARAREAERFAKAAEVRRAWLAGESNSTYVPGGGYLSDATGGALIRANGDELETSHGASVPLAHAVKAFRFVKLVRERGETWRTNGRKVRVGHYQIDAIDSGGFTAGCHRINWPEIERLARELGVYDAPADDSAVETSH